MLTGLQGKIGRVWAPALVWAFTSREMPKELQNMWLNKVLRLNFLSPCDKWHV